MLRLFLGCSFLISLLVYSSTYFQQMFVMGFWCWILIVNVSNILAIAMTTKFIWKNNPVIYNEIISDTADIGLMSGKHNILGG